MHALQTEINLWLSPSVKKHQNLLVLGPPCVPGFKYVAPLLACLKSHCQFANQVEGKFAMHFRQFIKSVGVEHGMQPRHRCVLTINIAKSGTCPVMPKMVVFKYLSCPAKSMNVITWKEKIPYLY